MKKWGKIGIGLVAVAVVAAGVCFFVFARRTPLTAAALDLDIAPVQRGNIEVLVHGTGMLEVDVTQDIFGRVSGRIQAIHKEDGDAVQAGELIALLENDALEDTLRKLTDDLYVMELELSSLRSNRSITVIRAPLAGRIKLLHASKGDDMATVQKQHGALAVLSTDGMMRVSVPTPESYPLPREPQDVKVYIGNQVESGTLLTADSQTLTVIIPNDTYDPGATALVRDDKGVELGSGTLAINKPVVVAGVSGKIKTVEVKENDKVKSQDRLFTLEDDTVTVDVEKQLLSRDQLQRQIDDTRKDIAELEIRAPINGILAGFSMREGAMVQDGMQIATVIQTDRAKVRLAVDELDVATVYPGQPAILKVDAIPSKRYDAFVDRVLPVGTRISDITSYDVLLYLDTQDNMLPYMSASGDIVVASAANTLLVPVAALQSVGEEKYVMIAPTDADLAGVTLRKGDTGSSAGLMMMSGQAQNNDFVTLRTIAPQLMRRVEIGLVSNEYVQILSGLQEGEQVVLPRSGTNLLNLMRMGGGALQ